jgi:hypothetical protein
MQYTCYGYDEDMKIGKEEVGLENNIEISSL